MNRIIAKIRVHIKFTKFTRSLVISPYMLLSNLKLVAPCLLFEIDPQSLVTEIYTFKKILPNSEVFHIVVELFYKAPSFLTASSAPTPGNLQRFSPQSYQGSRNPCLPFF